MLKFGWKQFFAFQSDSIQIFKLFCIINLLGVVMGADNSKRAQEDTKFKQFLEDIKKQQNEDYPVLQLKKKLKQNFAVDYFEKSKKLIEQRDSFEHASTVCLTIGNVTLYIGSGMSTTAAALQVLTQQNVSKLLQFTSTAFFGISIIFKGIAKYSNSRAEQRVAQLEYYKIQVGFSISPDQAEDQKQNKNVDVIVRQRKKSLPSPKKRNFNQL